MWGLEKQREGAETQLQSPENTLSPLLSHLHQCPACHLQCPLPPHHQSNHTHLGRKPGHPCPKVYLLKTPAALTVPTIHMVLLLVLTSLDRSRLPSPSVSSLEAEPGFPASVSLNRTQQQHISPHHPHLHSPQHPLEFAARQTSPCFPSVPTSVHLQALFLIHGCPFFACPILPTQGLA